MKKSLYLLLSRHIDTLLQHLFFLLFVVFCLSFYKERVLLHDTAYYLYRIVKDATFYIPHQRYGIAITQVLPVLAVRLGLSMKWVMKAFSLNMGLYYYALFLLIRYGLKDKWGGWLLALSFAFFAQSAHFYMVSEVQIGLSFAVFILLFVHHRLLKSPPPRKFDYFLLFLFLLSIGWIHFFIYIPLGAMLGYLIIEQGSKSPKIWRFILAFFLIAFLFHYTRISFGNSYQGSKLLSIGQLLDTFRQLVSHDNRRLWVDEIIHIDFYKEKFYVIIMVFGMLLFQQKYRIALYLIFLLGGFGILFLTTIPSGYPLPYKESYANVWGVLGIVYLFINNEWGTRWVKYYALLAIFVIGVGNARPSTQYYKDRVMGIKGLVAEMQSKRVAKTYLLRQDMRYSTGWEQAYETLLYSALHPPCVSSILVSSPPDSQFLQKKSILLGAEWDAETPIRNLPIRYFTLDTTTVYTQLTRN